MFFFWNKKVDFQKIRDFKDGINAIRVLIWTKEWEKARSALKEIRSKEKISFEESLKLLTNENGKERLTDEWNKNNKLIDNLEQKNNIKEALYKEQEAKNIFDLKFKKIRSEIQTLSKSGKYQEALTLLSNFFEENKGNLLVIKFYNSEKKKIIKFVEIQRAKDEANLQKNAEIEAMNLVGKVFTQKEEIKEPEQEKLSFDIFSPLKKSIRFYTSIIDGIEKKKLIDEVSRLITVENQVNTEMAKNKLEKVHQGLIKELAVTNINGYEFFGKILGADRITGDTFGFHEEKEKYDFFLGDATGHGIRAGLIVSLLSRLFSKFVAGNYLTKMVLEINNGLKQDLQSRNFITGIFFEISKDEINRIRFVGMGHEPIFIYRAAEKKVERLIPGGLAAGIRVIKDQAAVKEKDIFMSPDDILVCYSDGIVEARNIENILFGIDKLEKTFLRIASLEKNLNKIYNFLMEEVKIYRGGSKFDDDATIILLRRDEIKDIVTTQDTYLDDISKKEGIGKLTLRKFVGKTKEEVEKELEKIRKEKELLSIIKVLENFYYTGEILKLKQEAIRFINAGFIHKKINFYLKKAIANETSYRVEQKNKKITAKYHLLEELLKKGDYESVIKECTEVIAKEGNV